MTLYATRELSKKLEELGCVSDCDCGYDEEGYLLRCWQGHCSLKTSYFALDFIGPTEQARENCKKIWGDGELSGSTQIHNYPPFEWTGVKVIDLQRRHLISLPDQATFWAYIEDAIRGKYGEE